MYSITLDADRCKGDGACAQVCPVRIFQASEKKKPPRIGSTELCVRCGHCIAVCPTAALKHGALDASEFERVLDRQPVPAERFVECMRQRRSVRAYKDEPVPRELLERIVRVAGYAPTSAHGGEGWVRSTTIVTGAENMRRVVDLTAEYMRRLGSLLDSAIVKLVARWKEAPRAGRTMLPDLRMRLAEYDQGRDAITYDAPAAIFLHTPRDTPEPEANCNAAMMAILLAAHAHGLGTCWNGFLAKAATGFKVKSHMREMLQLPDHHDVYSAATIGYPRLRLHSLPQRETSIRWID